MFVMMKTRLLITIALGITLTGCTEKEPEIRTVCTRDDIGNYIVKWETSPAMEGTVSLYTSDNPEDFSQAQRAASAKIEDGVVTYITSDNFKRKYFRLNFNDEYTEIVGARYVRMDDIRNLRDVGGYHTAGGRQVKWGKIYRSGEITRMTPWDSTRLANLGIRTIIDLRTGEECEKHPIAYRRANIVHVPVVAGNEQDLSDRIWNNQMRKGDALLYMQDVYLQFATRNAAQFGQALDVFLHEENYPILFCCPLGKDRTGFLAALLLAILGVPEETIMQDYLESNQYINPAYYSEWVNGLNFDTQEAVTVMISARESFLSPVLMKINKQYGSVQKYLQKELNLTEKKQEELQRILLY